MSLSETHPPAPAPPPGIKAALGCGFGAAMAGLFVAPIAIFILGAIINGFNPVCGTPGDSGGCEMWLVGAALAAAIPGAVVGLVWGLTIGIRDILKARRSRRDIA